MQTEPSTLEAPLKIRGVLIIVAIGLIVAFVQNLAILGASVATLREPVWQRLTNPESSFYHPGWKPALIFGVISASVTFLLTMIAVVLFFRKHRFFPTFMVVAIPLMFVLMLTNYLLGGSIPAVVANPEYAKETEHLIVKFIALHLWIPYFLVSDRVKRTFVR